MGNSEKVKRFRRNQKQKIVDYLGGKCSICGYNRCIAALEVHHIDPSQKKFTISNSGVTRSWQRVLEEIQKCKLLCSNCHREEHFFVSSFRSIE